MKTNCPFCEGDKEGCCFCDHTGRIDIGEGQRFKNESEIKESLGVKFIKESDKAVNGGLEIWPEMIDFFLQDKNVPKWYKVK